MPSSAPSPWSMKRSELVEELDRRGIAVHHNWTVPELRSILLEQKELEKPPKGENPVKGLTKMTLAELSAEATRLEISMPPVPTRGLLMSPEDEVRLKRCF